MKDLLNSKKQSLTYDLANQKINDEDIKEAQKAADEALNNYLVGREKYYEQEKMKINAKLELVDELLSEV